MSGGNNTAEQNTNFVIFSGLSLVSMAVLIGVAGFWILSLTHQDYRDLLASGEPIIVQNKGVAFFYLIFPVLAGMALIGVYATAVGFIGERNPATNKRVMKLGSYLIIAGFVAMFAGRYVGTWHWAETFRSSGYSQCSGGFSITKQWARAVWTDDPALCVDREVRRMFASHEYGLADINNYVVERQASGE